MTYQKKIEDTQKSSRDNTHKELSDKEYWNNVIEKKSVGFKSFVKLPIIRNMALGFYNWDFFKICRKYIKPEYRSIFEVGCAPGNYLIQFHRSFGLSPYGIEYTENGIKSINLNFEQNHISGIIDHGDFFDAEYIKKNSGKFDIVYSLGFIEHFDNPQEAIENHFRLAKQGGLIIITIPNLPYLNKYFVEKSFLEIHNLTIMERDVLASYFSGQEILENRYFGGIFNFGGFIFTNKFLESLRLVLFVLQRLIFDPIFMILSFIGIDLSNKYSSPSMIIVARKKLDVETIEK